MNDLEKKKKLLYGIGGGIVLLGLIALGAYYFLSRASNTPSPTPQTPDTDITSGGLPVFGDSNTPTGTTPSGTTGIHTSNQTLLQLTSYAVISPSLSPKEDAVLFYQKDGGDLISLDMEGKNPQKISNTTVIGMTEAVWSPARTRSAVVYIDKEAKKSFLRIGTTSAVAFPQQTTSIAWSPDGASLAYLVQGGAGDTLDLVTADSSGNKRKSIFSTPLLDVSIRWISSDTIAFITAPSGLAEGYIFLYSRSSGTFKKFFGPSFGLSALWSPKATQVLIGKTNSGGREMNLTIVNTKTSEAFSLGDVTLPEKCTWTSEIELFCAIPKTLPTGLTLPDDYLRGMLHTEDKVIRIDLAKKSVLEVFSGGSFDISNPLITQKKEYLFFVDRNDGTLWKLKIAP